MNLINSILGGLLFFIQIVLLILFLVSLGGLVLVFAFIVTLDPIYIAMFIAIWVNAYFYYTSE